MFSQYCANIRGNDSSCSSSHNQLQQHRNRMATYWSREQINTLIQLYRDHHCLYDVKNKDYKNKRARKIALKEIQEEVLPLRPATTIEEIKAKLHGLRTTFMAEHKKVLASQNGPAEDVYQPTVWYYPMMLFVIKYANPRLTFQPGTNLFVTDATSRSSETQSFAEDLNDQKPQMDIGYVNAESPKLLEEDYFDDGDHHSEFAPQSGGGNNISSGGLPTAFPSFKRKADELSSSRESNSGKSNSGKNPKIGPCDMMLPTKRVVAVNVNRTSAQTSTSSTNNNNQNNGNSNNSTEAFLAFIATKLTAFEEDEDVLQEAEERITQVLFDLQRRLRNKKNANTSE